MSKIIMKIQGGLASQLHKYGIGRSIADAHNCELLLDLSWFQSSSSSDTKREFILDRFKSRFSVASSSDISELKSNRFQLFVDRIASNLLISTSFKKSTHLVSDFFDFDYETIALPVYIEGEWFGGKYLLENKSILMDDFQLLNSLNKKSNLIREDIESSESVAIHIRRGDYLTNSHARSFHFTTSKNYFRGSIKYMLERLNEPKFFVFSDDIQWAKNNISKLADNIEFIDNQSHLDDFELLRRCKHQIISNSGFSWLGAWLNSNERKIAIAPFRWVKNTDFNSIIVNDLKKDNFKILDL